VIAKPRSTAQKKNFLEAKSLSDRQLEKTRAEQARRQQQKQQEQEAKRQSLASAGFNGDPNSGLLEADDDESDGDVEDILLTLPRFGLRSTRSMTRI